MMAGNGLSVIAAVTAVGIFPFAKIAHREIDHGGVIAVITVKILKAPKDDAGVYMFEILCSNATYMGIPVCAAALGSSAEFYASIMCIIYNLVCFSLGVFLLAGKASFKRVFNPPFLAGALATVLYALKVPVPELITKATSFIGQATSPCAMR